MSSLEPWPKISSVCPVPSVNVVSAAGKGLLSQSMGSVGGTACSTVRSPSISKLPTVLPANVARFASGNPIRSSSSNAVMINSGRGAVLASNRQSPWKRVFVSTNPSLTFFMASLLVVVFGTSPRHRRKLSRGRKSFPLRKVRGGSDAASTLVFPVSRDCILRTFRIRRRALAEQRILLYRLVRS